MPAVMTPFGPVPPAVVAPAPAVAAGAAELSARTVVTRKDLEAFFADESRVIETRDGAPGVYEYDRTLTRGSFRDLYPELEPYREGSLPVTDGHTLHYEETGNPGGIPVIFLHGGPGGGIIPYYRRFFDPAKWRVVLLDQRGAGKSTPFSELKGNDTWSLVADIERLRGHLKIEKWAVFGGSWGATLALAYAETHPERVTGLILRGVFLGRKQELDWLYREGGAGSMFPDAWRRFAEFIPAPERRDLIPAYYKRLTSAEASVRKSAAVAWTRWETAISRLYVNWPGVKEVEDDPKADAFARIEAHYMINGLWIEEGRLLRDSARIRDIPAVIVQGRYDAVCPATSAYDLYRAIARSALILVPDSGHSAREPGIASALVEAADYFAGKLGKQ